MKSHISREILAVFAALLLITGVMIDSPNTQAQTGSEIDRYICSIDTLRSANLAMQEQLVTDEKIIAELRTEIDNLRQQVITVRAELEAVKAQKTTTPVQQYAPPPSQPVVAEAVSSYEEEYRKALEKFNQKDYTKAISMFQALIQRDMNNALSDNCQYWIGESYFGLKDYQKAIIEFEKVFSFSNTNKDDDAQLKLGITYIRMGQKEDARRELTRLLSNYPNSEFTALARKLLEEL